MTILYEKPKFSFCEMSGVPSVSIPYTETMPKLKPGSVVIYVCYTFNTLFRVGFKNVLLFVLFFVLYGTFYVYVL